MKNMKELGFEDLLNGFIIGEADLSGVKEYKSDEEFNKDKNKHLATKNWGKYGFILENVKRIKPTSAKGQLNFWEFKEKTLK